MNVNRVRSQSLDDDDNFSVYSRNSTGFYNSLNLANNSDSECSGPISVRDMIQHYNKQFLKSESNQANYKTKHRCTPARKHNSQHKLAATKSSFCGLNNYGSQIDKNNFNGQLNNEEKPMAVLDNNERHQIVCCRNCTACLCCQTRNLTNTITTPILPTLVTTPLLQPTNNEKNQNPSNHLNFRNNCCGNCNNIASNCCNQINAKNILAVENGTVIDETLNANKPNSCTNVGDMEAINKKDSIVDIHRNHLLQHRTSQTLVEHKQNHLLSTDSVEEAKKLQQQQQQPTETCYQSKTTIAKTSSGVRIIIDIFFDQEQCSTINNASDIVGSRVETDIPQSRILTEFQQQVMTKNNSNTDIVNTNTAATSVTSFQRG